uniref:Probable arginine--tRNA ligase, mitochondrial n=1 Tax=Macrostomum lignano TaxID=282301 RepID=A0A1I8IM10_9PLAT
MESFGRPELLGSEDDQQVSEQVSRLAVQHMQSVYARAGTELPAEAVESAYARLESGEPQAMRLWRLAKRHSLAELDACYRRLSVSFDRLEFESDYAKQTGKLLALLDRRGLLAAAPDGAKLLRLADSADDEAVVQKRDGSSLYFGRDLLAALDSRQSGLWTRPLRCRIGQRLHFDRLGRALTALGRPDLANPSPWPMHVEFGRVEGMSTRRSGSGGVVLLRDILDVGQARMLERSKASPNRRIDGSDASSIADRLAASVVAMEMMRVRRLQPVKFSWDSDNSAVGAQYCHARLCSLASKAAKAGISSPDDGSSIDLALNLVGPKAATAANELAEQLLAYPDTALEAFLTYEPCVLVAYTNRLVSRANACLRVLPVLTCAKDSGAIGRLALFNSTRSVLASAMRLVGLTPMLSI